MYNSVTEKKIKDIPHINGINLDRLPQELTKFYAQIISFRQNFTDDKLDDNNYHKNLETLYSLANNLETILIVYPSHEKKEQIAFVAGTAHSLIYKMTKYKQVEPNEILEIDSVSPLISAVILFLISNNQADAAEISKTISNLELLNNPKHKLTHYITSLAKGKLSKILDSPFTEENINQDNLSEKALDYLWRELGLGIYNIALNLSGGSSQTENSSFDNVIKLSNFKANNSFGNNNIFSGPYHLAKLLKLLEASITKKGVIHTPPPPNIDSQKWNSFLKKVAKNRPYLWDNHLEVVKTKFLFLGTSAILTLPTGAGKSTLSELKIASCLFSNRKVIFLVPTHALEDQVNKNLSSLFDEYSPENNEVDSEYTEFGLLENPSILVMTPERCLTLISLNPDLFNNVGLVVFDEFHLIHGTNLESNRRAFDSMFCITSLFTLIPNSDYLFISAMVSNGTEIAKWVSQVTKRECISFNSSWKPTRQLHGCLIFEEKDITLLNKEVHIEKSNPKRKKSPPKHLRDEMNIIPYSLFSLRNVWESKNSKDYFIVPILDKTIKLGLSKSWDLTANRNKVAAELAKHYIKLGLKTLVFVSSPILALSTAKEIKSEFSERVNNYSNFLSTNQEKINSLTLELGGLIFSYLETGQNIGVHHGLLLPIERELVEEYFKKKNGSAALVATATLAQGINLPAEVVIIAGDDRYNDSTNKLETIPPHELLNAAGRAGRAGQASHGIVILIPGTIVTIDDKNLSSRWWALKKEVFSQSDQCLTIEDPLEYFLDSIQDTSIILSPTQKNILFKYKPKYLSDTDTNNLLRKSFYAYKAAEKFEQNKFEAQIENLLQRRNELDVLSNVSDEDAWTKEISYKTGIAPEVILALNTSLEYEFLESFIHLSIIEFIEWFFKWLGNNNYLSKIFTKKSTLSHINKAVGLRPINQDIEAVIPRLSILKDLVCMYVKGIPLKEINEFIKTPLSPNRLDPYLSKARNFKIRLIPEISFALGLLSMILTEKAKHKGIDKENLPWNLKALASCVREGFNHSDKLFYKSDNQILSRVETHIKFKNK